VSTFLNTISQADVDMALIALTFHLGNLGFRSLAWRNVLGAAYSDRRVPLLGIAGAYAAGVAVNSFTPARGGDLVKIGLARTRIRDSSVATIGSSMGVVSALDAVIGVSLVLALAGLGALPSLPGVPALPSAPAALGDHAGVVIAVAVLLVAAAVVTGRRLAPRLVKLWQDLKRGLSILSAPRRYATEVVPVQLAAWGCRIGTAYFLLAALHVPATVTAAVIVVVVGGISTLVPTPGGVGTQQVLLAFLLQSTAPTATIVSFSVGMQAAVTTLNLLIGLTAAMLMLRTLRPVSALRALRQPA
jgi:glycosyltransferase 2 family protein